MKKQQSLKLITNNTSLKRGDSQKKLSTKKKSGLESNRSIQIYKCGCAVAPIKSLISVRSNLSQKVIKKSKVSIAKQNEIKQTNQVLKSSRSFKHLVKKLDLLKQEYKSLEKIKTQNKVQITNYIPKQVIKSVDKIVYVERPVQKINRKIKKVPREVLTYKQIQKQIQIFKEELIFVDAKPLPTIQQTVQVPQQTIFTRIVNNPINDRMKADYQMFSCRSVEILGLIEDSYNTISNLRTNIASLEGCIGKGSQSQTFHQTYTNIPQSNQQIPTFSTIQPKSQLLIPGGQLLSTSFLGSMVSSNINFCQQIYLKNPQDIGISKRQNLRLSGKRNCTQQCIEACVCMRNLFKVYSKQQIRHSQNI